MDALAALVHQGRAFEIHFGAEAFARALGGRGEGLAVRAQELGHAFRLAAIFGNAHSLLARAQTAPHLAIDAARMVGARVEILLATPQLEQIEKFGFKPRGGGAVAKRTEIDEPWRGRCARLPECAENGSRGPASRRAAGAAGFHCDSLPRDVARQIEHQELRGQPRAGELIFDASRGAAQVKRFRRAFARTSRRFSRLRSTLVRAR